MEEEPVAPVLAEEAEDGAADGQVQVEGAIDELELAGAAVEQALETGEEGFERELAHRDVERREAELAGERATSGGLDIEHAVGEVVVVVVGVRELEPGQVGDGGVEDARRRWGGGLEQGPAEVGEREVGFAGDGVIREGDDFLALGFVADLGAAEDDAEFGSEAFEQGDDLEGWADVPDVDAESEDTGLLGEQGFDDFERGLFDLEFGDGGARLEIAEVGEQVAQAERGVDEFGVERAEQDVRHAVDASARCGAGEGRKAGTGCVPAGPHGGGLPGARLSVAERRAEGAGGAQEIALVVDGLEASDGLGDGDGADGRAEEGHHPAELTRGDEFDGVGAEHGTEDAVEGGWAAAALEVAEHAIPDLLAGAFFDFGGDEGADAAEAGFAMGLLTGGGDEVGALFPGAFGDDDEGEEFSLLFAFLHLFADALELEGDLGDEDDVGAAGDAGVEGDPAGVAPHDFEDEDAVVAFGGGSEAVEGVGGARDGGVEAEGEDGALEVVVDGFGHADDGDAELVHLLGDAEGAVAADRDQGAEAEGLHAAFGVLEQFAGEAAAFAVAGFGGETASIGGAEDGAAAEQETVEFLVVQGLDAMRFEQSLIPAEDSDRLPAAFVCGFCDGADDGVQAGAISAPGDDANFLAHGWMSGSMSARSCVGRRAWAEWVFGGGDGGVRNSGFVPGVGSGRNGAMGETGMQGLSVLVLEDDGLLRRQLVAYLERAGADVTGVGDVAGARAAVGHLAFDLALLDVHLPDGLGTDLLKEDRFGPNAAVVVMTAEGGVSGAVEAMRLGAVDYLTKPFEMAELPLVFQRARGRRRTERLEAFRREDEAPRDDEFVFGSALDGLRAQLERILAADARMQTALAPVLIQGETGTGKTSVARWLHARGPRAARPLVEVNCSALPETLAESELFGHERGAFTDARAARLGLFEAADGGTLFLDEMASLSAPMQAKVLTAIEDRRIRRVGGNKPIAVDVRVVAASNRGLRELVAEGRFREDLYHRLDLFRLTLPSLRERPQDIVPLAQALMRRASRRHRLQPREITAEGRARLERYGWPGNVRELAHELERALVFEDGPLSFAHLAPMTTPGGGVGLVGEVERRAESGVLEPGSGDWFNAGYRFPEEGFSLDAALMRLVGHAVRQAGGNVSAAARLLGVSRDVVRYRLEGRAGKIGD